MTLAVIILAAGLGTRMKSSKPKVLHKLAGVPILNHVLNTANKLEHSLCAVVHGKNGDLIKSTTTGDNLHWVLQSEQLGTGHAVNTAITALREKLQAAKVTQVLILYGDVPLVDVNDLSRLLTTTDSDQLGLLTLNSSNPFGLGRIIRDKDDDNIVAIVEEKDADSHQKLISEVNTGIFLLPYPMVIPWLKDLKTNNNQHEYYLTDIVKQAVSTSTVINSVTVSDQDSYRGINNLYQLSQAERHYQFLYALRLLEQGVNINDPNRIDIRGNLVCANDVSIDINCIFKDQVILGSHCLIESNCVLKNVTIGNNVHIKANSIIEDSVINDNCVIGPFARVRPQTVLENNVNVGNFVEVKKSTIGEGSKVNHLSYIGDAVIGKNVNIGAGTITCNYDGFKKHQTIIGDNAFIGSNSSLVAPVTIGENSTIGAGSTICKDAPDNKLTLARGQQKTIENWQRIKDNSEE